MLLSGLMIHGIQPGPLMFTEYPGVVYGIFISVFLANIFMFLLMIFGMKWFIRVLKVPGYLLQPLILSLCVVGSFCHKQPPFRRMDSFVLRRSGVGYAPFEVSPAPLSCWGSCWSPSWR